MHLIQFILHSIDFSELLHNRRKRIAGIIGTREMEAKESIYMRMIAHRKWIIDEACGRMLYVGIFQTFSFKISLLWYA